MRDMRLFLLPTFAIIFVSCSERRASNQPIPKVAGVASDVTEPRFVFEAPDGFEWNDEHRLWHNKNNRTSITPAHSPGKSFQTIVDDFVADRMLAANLELVSKDVRDIDGRPTLLVYGNRLNAKSPQEFCVVAFGTRTGVAQATAIYPADLPEDQKTAIEDALLTSRYEFPD